MVWVKIDDGFPIHPKALRAGPLGMAMQLAALCHCNRHLTDGFVSRVVVPTLLNFDGLNMRCWMNEVFGSGEEATWELVVEDLVDAGMWEPVRGGWRIHDYEEYQPPASQGARRKLLSEKRREAGRKGGKRSAEARGREERSEQARRAAEARWDAQQMLSKPPADESPMLSKREANAQQTCSANVKQTKIGHPGNRPVTSANDQTDAKQTSSNEAPDPYPNFSFLNVALTEAYPSAEEDLAARQQYFLQQLEARAKAEGGQ